MAFTYIQAIELGFPAVQCHTVGLEDTYEGLIWDAGSPIPDKTTLDQWLASNPIIPQDRHVTVFAFRKRFTTAEKITLEMASIDNPTASMQARQMAAALRVTLKDTDSATYIDLDRPETRQGVFDLETYGIIAAGRALIILDTPVLMIERPLIPQFTVGN